MQKGKTWDADLVVWRSGSGRPCPHRPCVCRTEAGALVCNWNDFSATDGKGGGGGGFGELTLGEEDRPAVVVKIPVDGRRFLPTLADLVDRLTIVQLKMIFIPEHKDEYAQERADIEHDIDLILNEKSLKLDASAIHAVCMIMLTNRFIWENESKARAGGAEQDKLLKLTHSINGIRNAAKNQLATSDGGRKDYKVDALAADLPPEFGNWKVFGV